LQAYDVNIVFKDKELSRVQRLELGTRMSDVRDDEVHDAIVAYGVEKSSLVWRTTNMIPNYALRLRCKVSGS
jgi:hypothetical protein